MSSPQHGLVAYFVGHEQDNGSHKVRQKQRHI